MSVCIDCGGAAPDTWPPRCAPCFERWTDGTQSMSTESLPRGSAAILGDAAYYRDAAVRCRATGYPNTAETYDELAAMAARAAEETAA